MPKHCVNISSIEFKNLVSQLETDPISLATEISLWQDRNNTTELPSIEQATSLIGVSTPKDEQIIKESRNIYGRRASKAVLEGLAKKLNGKFRGAFHELLTSKEIAEKFGEERAKSKGFVVNGFLAIINTDLATLDTPIHEYGHIFMNSLKLVDKPLYDKIIDRSLTQSIRSKVESKYPELNNEELGEEIFVTLLGLNSQDKVAPDNWFNNNIKPLIEDFRKFVSDVFHQIFGYNNNETILDIDLDNSLIDVINKVNDTLLGRKRLGVNLELNQNILTIIDDLNKTKFSKKIEIDNERDLTNFLVGEDPEGVIDFDKFAKNIVLQSKSRMIGGKKVYGYIGLNGKFVPFESTDQKEQIAQVKKERVGEIDRSKKDLAKNIITYFKEGNENGLFNNEGSYIRNIEQVVKPYDKSNTKMDQLSKYGLEGDDIIVVDLGNNNYDLIAVSGSNLNQKFKLDKGTNILGNFLTDYQSKYTNTPINLQATRKDVKLLRLGLIAMQLKEKNPKAKFNRLITQNFTFDNKNIPFTTDLANLLPQIKEIRDNKEINLLLGDELKNLLYKEDLYNAESYQQDYINTYRIFIESKLGENMIVSTKEAKLASLIEDYKNDQVTKEDLTKSFEDRLLAIQKDARRNNTSRDELEQNYEYQVIAHAILQLRKVDISLKNDLNTFRKYIDSGNMTAKPLIDVVVTETKNRLSAIRILFTRDYKTEANKKIEALIADYHKNFGGMGVVSDYTIGDTTRYFEPLYETIKVNNQGTEIEVKNGFLKRKGTEAYNNLTDTQKEFITWFNNHIKKQFGMLMTEEEFKEFGALWSDGMIPLMKSSFTNQFYKGNYKKAVSRFFNRFTNYNDVFEGDVVNDFTKLPELFKSQLGKGIYGSTFRQNLIGLTDDNKLIDKEANDNIETNLEVILDLFTMNSLRKSELDKMLPVYSATRAVLTFQEHNLFNRTTNVKDYIDLYIQKVAFNLNKSVKGLEPVDKFNDNIMAATSMQIIGLNIVNPVTNFFTGLFGNISSFTSNMIGNKDMFGFKEWGLAAAKIATGVELTNELMYEYGLTNMDYDSLLGSKFKVTDRTIFKSRSMYWLNSVGDYIHRAHIFIAQMIKDGTLDAHKIVDGKLTYDEDLDKRFIGENGQALKKALKAELAREPGGLDENGRMLRAYDNRLRNKYKQFADTVFGSYDRETQSNIQIYSWTRLITHMRKWVISKYERLYKQGHINETLGNYKFVDINGEKVAVWEGRYIEGIFQTLQLVTYNVTHFNNKKSLNNTQRENLGKLASDIVYFGLLTAIMKMLFDDDDTDVTKKYKRSLNNAVGDLMSTYSPVTYIGSFSANPIVSLSYMNRILELSASLITLDFDKFESQASRNLFIYRDVKTLSDIINNK